MNFFSMLTSKDSKNNSQPLTSIYDIQINSLQGNSINLSNFKDKYLLIVNVASKCGFTPQYKELQKLHEKYKKSLIVIGVPCNQFGQQEPGEAFEIQEFCEANYGVEFLITEKIDVKGNNQHPLFKWLTDKSLNGCKDSKVKWNFQKYLINPKGNLIDYFYSTTSPISKKITKYL
ncbi:MAG: glutathione peroxidase [Glaciecola sp.]|jgi:glutathione peroxidase